MKKLLLMLVPAAALFANAPANAYEAKDFIGKVCGQVWLGNPLNTTCAIDGSYGVFEADPTNASNVILKGFRHCDEVKFQVSGNTLTLIDSDSNIVAYDEDNNTQYDIFTTSYQTQNKYVNGYGYALFYNFYGPTGLWQGTISDFTDRDCLKVTFDCGRGLAFMDELSFSMIHNISQKAFFYVFEPNGTQYMNTSKGEKEVPVRVNVEIESDEKTTYGIQNFAGMGWTCRNEEDELVVNFINYGILASVDNSYNVTIADQAMAGIAKTTGWTSTSGGGFWCGANVTYTGNRKIRKTATGGNVTGTYRPLATHISGENMWHRDHDGDFRIYEDAEISIDNWVVQKVIDNGAGTDFTVSESTIQFENDVTPNVKLNINSFGFDPARGMYMTCSLSDYKHAEQVESYEIYAVPNHYTSVKDAGFLPHDFKGHEMAVCLEDYSSKTAANGGELEYYIPIEDFEGFGWNKNNKDYTFFVKFNLKPLARSTSAAFGAMALSSEGTPTGIGETVSDTNASITAGAGEISVSGAASVEIYTLSGTQVYAGGEGTVAVAAGIYVVKADGTVRKVTVK